MFYTFFINSRLNGLFLVNGLYRMTICRTPKKTHPWLKCFLKSSRWFYWIYDLLNIWIYGFFAEIEVGLLHFKIYCVANISVPKIDLYFCYAIRQCRLRGWLGELSTDVFDKLTIEHRKPKNGDFKRKLKI